MKRPKFQLPDETGRPPVDTPVEEVSNVTQAAKEPNLILRIGSDGKLMVTGMQPKTKDKLRRLLSDPTVKSELFGASADVVGPKFPRETVAYGYRLLGEIEAYLFSLPFFGEVPIDVSRQLFAFDQNEVVALTEPTCKVMEKHASVWLLTHGEELQLVVMLSWIHRVHFARFQAWRVAQGQASGQVVVNPPTQPAPEKTDGNAAGIAVPSLTDVSV